MSRGVIFLTSFVFFFFSFSVFAPAQDQDTGNTPYFDYAFKEFGIFSGYHHGTLKAQDDYIVIPAMLHWGFDLRPLIKNKSNILLEVVLEPFINTVVSPDSNVEIGNNFLLKIGFPLTPRIYPYFEGGLGMVYLTQHTIEQSTQFNFTDQAGVGITFFLKKNLGLSLGYRFRHISNASIKEPNNGINTDSAICGISFLY